MSVQKLSDDLVATLTCPQGRAHIEIFDTMMRGLYVDVLANGRMAFRVRYRQDGKKRGHTLGDARLLTVAEARDLARTALRKVIAGGDPKAMDLPIDGPTIEHFYTQQYLPYVKSYKRSWDTDETMIRNHLVPALGDRAMGSLIPPDIARVVESMRSPAARPPRCTTDRFHSFNVSRCSMAERVMLGLGEFRFEIATASYQKFSLNQSWRWPEQARINRDPSLQFVGRNVGEIELDGVIYPGFKGGLGQIEAMRALADAGKPQQLVDGLGRIWGAWVITEIGDTRTVFADDGQPRKLEFRVKLKAYGEDDLGQSTIKPAARTASAIASVTSVTEASTQLAALTTAADALPEITPAMTPTALQSAISATQDVVAEVTQTVAGIASEVSGAINGAVGELRQAVLDAIPPQALQAVRDVQDAVGEIVALRQSLQATVAGVKNLPAALKRDVAGIDGALQLASFRIKSSGDVLRDTQTTLSTIARLGDAAATRAQQAAADTAGSIAKSAEQINALCVKAQGCTGKIVEKWEGWHA